MFTIKFVGSPPFLLILSGQAKYFFIPFKGTSKPKKERKKKGGGGTNKQILNKKNCSGLVVCLPLGLSVVRRFY